jgi:hypothetical protein
LRTADQRALAAKSAVGSDSVRLSPVEIAKQPPDEIRHTVRRLVQASDNPWLTGVCCINMDEQVTDQQVAAIFDEIESMRAEYEAVEQCL